MLLVLMSAESEAHLPVRGAGCGCLPLHLGAHPGPPLHAVAPQPIQDGGRRTIVDTLQDCRHLTRL